ncbi:PREDICTED: uncharacterized protein LOC108772374 [Cyphomyrmex costatus]|uniref:uncharacterized protein LOC108772374 n=1 Tax=Cyphomyrmex costatus TaxID=456900 RepID=UPI0008521D12|nr:PREDICTED: uncharacterized protein LOC108772374 [Cyphomyrmex costatus]
MAEEALGQISSYRVPKIPPFWAKDLEIWFATVEASFHIAKITDDTTKFHIILANADTAILPHIKDLILNPPASGKYDTLKERVLNVFSISQGAKLRQLLKGQVLGEKKPSHLLQELNLAEDNATDSIIKTLFIEQLPESYRTILATIEEPDLSKLASIADRIAESVSSNNALAPVTRSKAEDLASDHTPQASPINKPSKQSLLEQLVQGMNTLLCERRSRSRSSSPGNSRHSMRRRNRFRSMDRKCFYHRKFGSKAYRCQQPCNWIDEKATQEN